MYKLSFQITPLPSSFNISVDTIAFSSEVFNQMSGDEDDVGRQFEMYVERGPFVSVEFLR